MVQRCVVGGCSNIKSEKVALHHYPSDVSLWPAWDRFVRGTRKNFNNGHARTTVCSDHFNEEDFENLMQWQLGASKNLRLKKTAIPSRKPRALAVSAVTVDQPTSGPAKKTRKNRALLAMKLQMARETISLRSKTDPVQKPDPAGHCDAGAEEEDEFNGCNGDEDMAAKQSDSLSGDSVPEHKVSIGIQATVRVPYRSKKIGAKPVMLDAAVQCCLCVPVEKAVFSETPREPVQLQVCQLPPVDTGELHRPEANLDSPSNHLLSGSRPEAHMEDKYIVFHENLMALFAACPKCAHQSSASVKKIEGSCISVSQQCLNAECGFSRTWSSQPYHQKMALGNLLLSSAILFSGSLPTQAIRMFELMRIKTISINTYFRHQREYLFPTVEIQWETEQKALTTELQSTGEPLVLVGDGRSDSPGHCAKYGSYTVMEQRIQKVLDIQIVQSSEVKNSTWCELEGLKRTMTYLSSNNLAVGTIVTDRHPQINKWLRDNHKETRHLFDIWHIAKAVSKKLDKLCAVKGCEDIGLWKRAFKNHLYWSAVSTSDNNGETIRAKWLSLLYHVQDIHTDFPLPEFPACQHDELEEERVWLEPTTKAFISLEKVVTDKKLLNDVSRMSSGEQTAALEAFHSLILQFAPKHTAFSWLGMRTRLRLAAMHYNENSERNQAKTATGEPRYNVYYSKTKHFEARVRPVATKQTINYATNLQGALLRMYRESPSRLRSSIDSTKQLKPGSLCDKAMRVEKQSAVENHLHRFHVQGGIVTESNSQSACASRNDEDM